MKNKVSILNSPQLRSTNGRNSFLRNNSLVRVLVGSHRGKESSIIRVFPNGYVSLKDVNVTNSRGKDVPVKIHHSNLMIIGTQ